MKQVSTSNAFASGSDSSSLISSARKIYADGARAWRISPNTLTIILAIPFLIALTGVIAALIGKDAYKWFTQEDGFAETMQVVFYSLALVLCLVITRLHWRSGNKVVALLYAGLCVGLFFLVGEELNWGQRIFGWHTSESFASINKQDETNLHNIYGVGTAFKWIQLVVGAYGTLLPLIFMKWKISSRFSKYLPMVVPHYTLIPYFVMLFFWRIFRNLFEVSDRFYFVVAEYNEVMEFVLATGLFFFMVFQLQKLKGSEDSELIENRMPSVLR
jgi:hypothetical protein